MTWNLYYWNKFPKHATNRLFRDTVTLKITVLSKSLRWSKKSCLYLWKKNNLCILELFSNSFMNITCREYAWNIFRFELLNPIQYTRLVALVEARIAKFLSNNHTANSHRLYASIRSRALRSRVKHMLQVRSHIPPYSGHDNSG